MDNASRYGTHGGHEHQGTNNNPNRLASSTSPQNKFSYTYIVVNLCPGTPDKKAYKLLTKKPSLLYNYFFIDQPRASSVAKNTKAYNAAIFYSD